jgi:hypothetical protein
MKKFLFLAVMIAGLLSFTNQVNAQWLKVGTVAGDTVVTSASKDTVQKVCPLTDGYSSTSFRITYTKISGTIALKAYLYPGDGTSYDATPSDSTVAFGSASGVIFIDKPVVLPRSHYRIDVRTSDGANTTQSVKIEVAYLPKRYRH